MTRTEVAVLVGIVAIGFVLRLEPWLRDPAIAPSGGHATPEEWELPLVRMMRREPVLGFEVAHENARFRVLALAGADSVNRAAGGTQPAVAESHSPTAAPGADR